jgi:hypothetical protein
MHSEAGIKSFFRSSSGPVADGILPAESLRKYEFWPMFGDSNI